MTTIKKGLGVLLLSGFIPAISMAQDPGDLLQNITSTISVSNVDGFTISQQIGSPLSIPVLETGDDVLLQGLFCALIRISSDGTSGINGIFADEENFAISYDPVWKLLSVNIPLAEDVNVFVVDMEGRTVIMQQASTVLTSIDVSTLPSGIYMAGIASNNKYYKTFKFIVK